jgi:hypothetical protein
VLQPGTQRRDFRQQGRQVRGDSDDALSRFVDRSRQMRHSDAGVQCVTDESGAHRRVVDLEVMLRVPRQRADAISPSQPERQQSAGRTIATLAHRAVADATDDLACFGGDDFPMRRPLRRVLEKFVDRQGVLLHARQNVFISRNPY